MAFEPEHRYIAYADRLVFNENPDFCFHPHQHSQLELLFVRAGRYAFSAGGRTETFGPGEIFIANSGEEHHGDGLMEADERGEYFYIQLSLKKTPRGLSGELDEFLEKLEKGELLLPYRISAEQAESTGLFARGEEVLECFTAKNGYNHFKLLCRSLPLYQVLLEHRLYVDAERKDQAVDPFVQQLTEYIEAHYAEELRLETVSAHYGYEPHYFCSLFKKHFKLNFTKYINAVRMQKFLSHPELSMQTIAKCAADVGFSNYSYFHRIFCRVYHAPPSQYLPRHRN